MISGIILAKGKTGAYFFPVKIGGKTFFVKVYEKHKLDTPKVVVGVSACYLDGSTPRYHVSIDADNKPLPKHMTEKAMAEGSVIYYRKYVRERVKEHLIAKCACSKSKAIRESMRYDDNKHLKHKHRPGMIPECYRWGVIRITPLPGEEDIVVYIDTRDPLGRLIEMLRESI